MEKKKETMTQIMKDLHQQIEEALERIEAVANNANTTNEGKTPHHPARVYIK